MGKTKVIAFEGIDGSGKTVQLEHLLAALKAEGKTVAAMSFPMYESYFGSEVGRLLSGSGGVRADEVDAKSMALWFALDRYEALKDYRDGVMDVLLINRYVLSNAVYQSIRERDTMDMLDFVLTLEYEHFNLPVADAYVYLDVATKDAKNNVKQKGHRDYMGGEGGDVYEQITSMQMRAREKYLSYTQKLDNLFVVDCMQDDALLSPKEIANKVLEKLKNEKLI